MEGWKRYALVACAASCAVAAAGLIIFAALGDLATADQAGSIVGATASLVGVVTSVWALMRPAGAAVTALDGAVAAGGHIGRVVSGNNNRLPPLPAVAAQDAPSRDGEGVCASGTDSVAAGGSVYEVVHGDGNGS